MYLVAGIFPSFSIRERVQTIGMPDQGSARRRHRAPPSSVEPPSPCRFVPAGQPGAYASVVHHVGRKHPAARTRHRLTAVLDGRTGFVIALPYGLKSDWLRNVLASGSATITHEGNDFPRRAARSCAADGR